MTTVTTCSGNFYTGALHSCAKCGGNGVVQEEQPYRIAQETSAADSVCAECGGSGYSEKPSPLSYRDLRSRVIDLQIERDIDPTGGYLSDPFKKLNDEYDRVYQEATTAFDIAARREISQEDFGLEPLGLATWYVPLPEQTGRFDPLTEGETQSLLRIVARILATENILLPPEPARPWEWPFDDRMESYEKQRIIPGYRRVNNTTVPYNLQQSRKLGRYIQAIGRRAPRPRPYRRYWAMDERTTMAFMERPQGFQGSRQRRAQGQR